MTLILAEIAFMGADDHSRARFWHDGTLTDIDCSACYTFLPMKEQHYAAIPFPLFA